MRLKPMPPKPRAFAQLPASYNEYANPALKKQAALQSFAKTLLDARTTRYQPLLDRVAATIATNRARAYERRTRQRRATGRDLGLPRPPRQPRRATQDRRRGAHEQQGNAFGGSWRAFVLWIRPARERSHPVRRRIPAHGAIRAAMTRSSICAPLLKWPKALGIARKALSEPTLGSPHSSQPERNHVALFSLRARRAWCHRGVAMPGHVLSRAVKASRPLRGRTWQAFARSHVPEPLRDKLGALALSGSAR